MPAKRIPAKPTAKAADDAPRRVCLGQFVGAHGIRGAVRLKSYTADPDDITAYGTLSDEQGSRQFAVRLTGRAKGVLLAEVDGISDRTMAEALRGTRLFVARDALPSPENDEYYHIDLVGLRVETPDGTTLGRVSAIHDHGAGDIVEIQRSKGQSMLLPFTREHVPTVEIAEGRIVVVIPPVEDADPEPAEEDA